mmetsp:Transcript_8623/g.35930  ORF Transcript_8623/g.35930 Transcript_8623/m.35930 type:complete len:318 (+) Transcript_8623:82-1035(+)
MPHTGTNMAAVQSLAGTSVWRRMRWENELDNVDTACVFASIISALLISGSCALGFLCLAFWGVEWLYDELQDSNGDVDVGWDVLFVALTVISLASAVVIFFAGFLGLGFFCAVPLVHWFSRYRMTSVTNNTKDLLLVPVGTNFGLPASSCRRVARQLANSGPLQQLAISLWTEPGSLEGIFDAVTALDKFALAMNRAMTEGEISAMARMIRRCEGLRWVHLSFGGEERHMPCDEIVYGLADAEELEWVMLDGAACGECLPMIGNAMAQHWRLEELDLTHIDARPEHVEYAVETLLAGCPRLRRLNMDACSAHDDRHW